MSCNRNCIGSSIASALNVCGVQIKNNCGPGCTGLSLGQSMIQVDISGNLVVCSNIGGNCDCVTLGTGSGSLVDNDNGTITYTSSNNTSYPIDICAIVANNCNPALIANGGNLEFTDVAGDTNIIDICAMLDNCALEDLGDVTLTAPAVGEVLTYDGGDWINQPIAVSPVDICAAVVANCNTAITDNNDGTITFTDNNGDPTVLDICNILTDGGCDATGTDSLSVLGSVVTHIARDGTNVAFDVCAMVAANCSDSLIDNGNGTYTHTSINGLPTLIDICGDVATHCNPSLADAGGGILQFIDVAGAPTNIDICALIAGGGCTDTLTDNADGTYTHTGLDGTPQNIDICGSLIHCDLDDIGNVAAGATPGQILSFNGVDWIPQDQPTDILIDNGDGTYTHTAVNGTPQIIDICAAVDVVDTSDCITLAKNVTATGCSITAAPVIDPDACNGFECRVDGFYVNNDIQTVTDFATVPSNTVNIAAPGGLPAVPTVFGGTVNLTLSNPSLCNPMSFTREVPASVAVFINNCGVAPAVISGTLEWSANGGATWNTVETASATVGVGEEITLPIAGITSSFIQAVGGTNSLDVRATFWNPDGNFCGVFSTADKSISGNGVNYIV